MTSDKIEELKKKRDDLSTQLAEVIRQLDASVGEAKEELKIEITSTVFTNDKISTKWTTFRNGEIKGLQLSLILDMLYQVKESLLNSAKDGVRREVMNRVKKN